MNFKRLLSTLAVSLSLLAPIACARIDAPTYDAVVAARPAIGDVVFETDPGPLGNSLAKVLGTWTNHVGVIVAYRHGDWVVAESKIPLVTETPLRCFLGRSVKAQFAIYRLKTPPTPAEQETMLKFADSQVGTPYALSFDLRSKNTFCSKFVHDDIYAATHQSLGEVETFDQLFRNNPAAPLAFWRIWFLGSVPWQRTTITPASQLRSPLLTPVYLHNV